MITPNEIKKILQEEGLPPNKLMGQHFLLDQTIIERMIEGVDLDAIETIVEIGPGLGVLTEALVRTGKPVVALEKERALALRLKDKFKNNTNVTIINEDVLTFNIGETLKNVGPYSIIANLPYNITARFLKLFLSGTDNKPNELMIMIQREVAHRLVAKPGKLTKIALLSQVYGKPKIYLDDIDPSYFYPSPKVISAVVSIKIIKELLTIFPQYEDRFWQLVRIGFSTRRKTLTNNLSAGLHLGAGEVRKMLTLAKIEPSLRAEALTILDWVKLVDIYTKIHCR